MSSALYKSTVTYRLDSWELIRQFGLLYFSSERGTLIHDSLLTHYSEPLEITKVIILSEINENIMSCKDFEMFPPFLICYSSINTLNLAYSTWAVDVWAEYLIFCVSWADPFRNQTVFDHFTLPIDIHFWQSVDCTHSYIYIFWIAIHLFTDKTHLVWVLLPYIWITSRMMLIVHVMLSINIQLLGCSRVEDDSRSIWPVRIISIRKYLRCHLVHTSNKHFSS